jgi:hypothetical protein
MWLRGGTEMTIDNSKQMLLKVLDKIERLLVGDIVTYNGPNDCVAWKRKSAAMGACGGYQIILSRPRRGRANRFPGGAHIFMLEFLSMF